MLLDSIGSVVQSFYYGPEVLSAKELLFKCVCVLKLDDAPHFMSWQKSDDKSKLDMEDLLALVSFAA